MPSILARSGRTSTVQLRAPAKLNLSLAVLARRPDGFHEIESLMVPVTLHDTLRVRRTDTPDIVLRVSWGGRLASAEGRALARDVPSDDRNLVVRAARALAAAAGVTAGLEIDLVKEIPSGAGLGGGSSDAAATLMAAAQAWGLDWPREKLAAVAAEIGSDVPWFFAGGPAIARGRGERVEPVAGLHAWPAVIACPAGGLSTAAVYAGCTPSMARHGDAARLATALAGGGLAAAIPFMHNDLEPPARQASADVDALLETLARAGATAPRLTGSGSACFAICRTLTEARGIAARLAAERSPHDGGAARWPGVFVVRLAHPDLAHPDLGDPEPGGLCSERQI
jgi:4-diphosphocytidyl-2-C-methyl-D-erythritol kinase